MDLFKRLLLTKFPNFWGAENMNPISMFISFISAKEFFSIINRKVIENHKLNLFDINIDPLEFKMGFWDNPNSANQKDVETYFSYCAAANLNGYLFYSPANLSNGLTLLASLYFSDAMQEYEESYFVHLLYTIFLLSFTITARVKVFPHDNDQENYNWFIELFFEAYQVTLHQLGIAPKPLLFQQIKKSLLRETDYFFVLFRAYQNFNNLLASSGSDEDFLSWIFGENSGAKQKWAIEEFIASYEKTKSRSDFSLLEQELLMMIWPADILIKYLLGDVSPFIIVDEIIKRIYDKKELDPIIKSFTKSGQNLQSLFNYLLDYKRYKEGFFRWVQEVMMRHFRGQGEVEEMIMDLDEMISSIDVSNEDASQIQVPERIKKESKITEKLLNFYVTFLGGFTTARGDSFYFRLFKAPWLQEFCSTTTGDLLYPSEQMRYYSSMLYLYNKNLYYYHYIDQNIRSGKNKFTIPTKGKNLKIAPNFSVVKLYNQAMLATFFQDVNPRDTKLYIKNSEILGLFKERFWENISQWLKGESRVFLENFYGPMSKKTFLSGDFVTIIDASLLETELINLKNSLYSLDYWFNREVLDLLYPLLSKKKGLHPEYFFSLFAIQRETLFGIALLMHYLSKKSKKLQTLVLPLRLYYFRDIVNLNLPMNSSFFSKFQKLLWEYTVFFDLWIQLDDNQEFLEILVKNIKKIFEKSPDANIVKNFTGDDRVWFKGALKNISYYNKRYLIPR